MRCAAQASLSASRGRQRVRVDVPEEVPLERGSYLLGVIKQRGALWQTLLRQTAAKKCVRVSE